ncbi:cupin domain-containing protein [Sphingomonas sp. JC676]|nr:cupin domain-containing protein [Sphingomonas sp. JC676]
MAAHRGLKLVKSRRRKPGGDFGRFGLKDAKGEAVFGFDKDRLVATATEIEDHLRGDTRETWGKSAGSVKARPKPKPAPAPKPKPRFKVKVDNLLAKLPAARRAEAFTELFARPGIRVERIVSRGQATPEAEPMVQDGDEWVLLLEGAAGLRIEDSDEVRLGPGDHVWIAAGQRHWVTWTARDRPTVWLAVHLG